jgi:hypothetical protein
LDLKEFLLSLGFKPSKSAPCLFILINEKGKIFVLNYVDDMLYFGTCDSEVKMFEERLQQRFNLELLGQAHWYLATRISQLSNFDIELDQSRYCQSIVKKYLETAGTKKVLTVHSTPLPSDFIPSVADCSVNETSSQQLAVEYNIDYASCIGSLIYLGMTRVDIIFAVNKLAKFTHKPGKIHFNALIHLLRYLRDHSSVGIRFYSDVSTAPIIQTLASENIKPNHPFYGFSDSSWNDDVDHGRSTGCYLMFYMGGVVDHSSNLPDPVALSSAEAEYNEGCLAFMAASHLRMILAELEGIEETDLKPTIIFFDSNSAIAMGKSYKDTKHTRHIMRRYHYVREGISSNRFIMEWLRTNVQLADIGTKNNPGPRHAELLNLIHVKLGNLTKIQEG